jgi:hypothetical protein
LPRCEQGRVEDRALLSGKRRMVTTGMAGGHATLHTQLQNSNKATCTLKLMELAWRTYPLAHGLENEDNDCPLRSGTRKACEDMYALLLHCVSYAGLLQPCPVHGPTNERTNERLCFHPWCSLHGALTASHSSDAPFLRLEPTVSSHSRITSKRKT